MTGHRTVAIATITAVLASAGTATAAKLITSSDIKDGAVANRDLKKNAISLNRLSPGVRKQLAKAPVAGVSGTPTPVAGQSGAPGAPGAAGGAGGSGTNGTNGAPGARGETGARGDTGATGATGPTGAKGDTGAKGEAGAKGDTGAKGEAGAKGDAGAKGEAGAKGDTGGKGETGAKGETGSQGQPGQAIVANVTTEPNPGLNNLRVVQVQRTTANDASPGPENSDPGTVLVQTPLPAGRYILAGTAQFATLGGTANAFGLARVFVGNTSQGSLIFTAEIPAQPLLGQTGAATEITVPTGGATVSLRAQAQSAAGDTVLGGANLLITQVSQG